MIRLVPLSPAVIVALLAATATAQTQPKFATGDPSTLSCRVVDVDELDDHARIVTIEVKNPGPTAAEPLAFEIRWRDRKAKTERVERCERAALPHVARWGRPTPAGGKQRYRIRTSLPIGKRGAEVAVVAAAFHDGAPVAAPEIGIGTPEQVQRTSLAGTFGVTQVALHNPFDHAVDLLLQVELTQPTDCTELFGVRLPAGGDLDWLLTSRPGSASPYLDPDLPPGAMLKATKFTVVDWILVGEPDAAAGGNVLEPAWTTWYRWPERDLTVSGEFTYRERLQRAGTPGEYDDFVITGRFTLEHGTPRVVVASGEGANPAGALLALFADVLRPDFATLARGAGLEPVTGDRVAIRGRGWRLGSQRSSVALQNGETPANAYENLEVKDGRIVSSGYGDGERTLWEHRDAGPGREGWLVTRRHDGSTDTSYAYAEHGSRLVPTYLAETVRYGEALYRSSELTIRNPTFDGRDAVAPVPPAGPGAATLRAIWDSAYRLTSEPIELEARFEVRNPGTDLIWRGQKKLSGKVQVRGFGRNLVHADFDFDGELSAELRLGLAAAIRDRWLLWYSRDPNCRAAFDEQFEGATIADKTTSGEFPIENGRGIERVRTRDGVLVGFERAGGVAVRVQTAKIGDRVAVTRIEEDFGKWQSAIAVELTPVGGHLLPKKLVLERVFDRRWGPETLTFQSWKVR
ncbi:MAG: hypothetical protein KDE27_00065 [Planctomycetes bacterium]|nr:hypothetical protein [Planctomycetota bacterium]